MSKDKAFSVHSTTVFPHSCSITSGILFRMWNNDFVKEGGRPLFDGMFCGHSIP